MTLNEQIRMFENACEQERNDARMMLRYTELFNDTLLRSNETAHFTASSWIVNPDHTKVVMVYHNIYQSWAWTGGHADGDSNLLDVAIREAREETGILHVRPLSEAPISLEILTVNAHFKKGKYVVPHLHLNLTFLLEADEADLLRSKPDENSGVRWFSLEDAVRASTEPDMKVIYRKLNDRIADFQRSPVNAIIN